MKTKHVVVIPYDPKWQQDFGKIKAELTTALSDSFLCIEHVGSTSVEGLAAKPVIDIDVVIESMAQFETVKKKLASIGYFHEGDLGIHGREAFSFSGKEHLQKHHLYVCPKDSDELFRHLKFRDYLRTHPNAVKEYGRVKMAGAKLFPEDIEKYIEYKSPCIEKMYKACGLIK